ncbi:olfactory receptor 51T1 [Vombatus ursinus]|uniref:olfactory receptor 51T1 n=1 Tax=Vombatus ursinus TaxID=29139 RepID=UPI000FFD0914|nr:olfactory receptor 51T1 [Vombatus ursinus]
MLVLNNTTSLSPTFRLTAFPGLEGNHMWLSIPFSCLYATALLGNSMILFVIITERSLHKPRYYFVSMLSGVDLGLTITTLPTMLGVLWFNLQEISLNACIIQMFFLHFFSFLESSVLLAMAFDRFMAICDPLRYAAILTNSTIMLIGLVIFVKQMACILPIVLALKGLSFHRGHELSHPYCYHPDMIKHSCTNPWLSSLIGLFFLLSHSGVDLLFILLSYILILRTLLSITSPNERRKAFNTCVSHIAAVTIFFVPMISVSLTHRLFVTAPHIVPVIMANIYLLLPPILNPIIYSLKTKLIRQALLRLLQSKEALSQGNWQTPAQRPTNCVEDGCPPAAEPTRALAQPQVRRQPPAARTPTPYPASFSVTPQNAEKPHLALTNTSYYYQLQVSTK